MNDTIDIQTVYVENMQTQRSRFSPKNSDFGTYEMAPNGFSGSIVSMDPRATRDQYFVRAVERKLLRVVPDDEAQERIGTMPDFENRGELTDIQTRLNDALAKSAEETAGSRFTKDVPDMARPVPGATMTAESVISTVGGEASGERPKEVRRAGAAVSGGVIGQEPVAELQGPLSPEQVLQPRQKLPDPPEGS